MAPIASSVDNFTDDLCKAFASSNIPIHKLEQKELQTFLEKYTKKAIPSSMSLTRALEAASKEVS